MDKFNYLRTLLTGQAKSAIAGFSLTTANYESAVQLLKKRYGKDTLIKRTHIQELLNVQPVYSAKDCGRLRAMYDKIEAHYRGLEALGVDEATYSDIVVPAILEKIPEIVRLTITRDHPHSEWSMSDVLTAMEKEIELRELYQTSRPDEDRRRRNNGQSTGNALNVTKQDENCAFCQGKHQHEDCKKVTDTKERKHILMKYSRCFNCMKRGHRARDCKHVIFCKNCKSKHHTAMCEAGAEGADDTAAHDSSNTEVPQQNLHVSSRSRVALQTAQAHIKGRGEARVRVLFDSASQNSFVTSKTAKSLSLPSVRKEWFAVKTFGNQCSGSRLHDVVSVELAPMGGGQSLRIEAFVVPEISHVKNEHVEVLKHHYSHLKNIWFSDVHRQAEELEIDILIGADYLWQFQTGVTIRGKADDPVAVQTFLGWTLSGPLKVSSSRETGNVAHVHFVGRNEKLTCDVQRLWDLETLGIPPVNEVHEEFVDSISFENDRYSVKLPWKEGHDTLTSNYNTCVTRLKGQVRKLKSDPTLLNEYDAIMKQQLESGVIEKVAELESADKIHYLPRLAVVRKEAVTTKLRIVYDASAKGDNGKGASLNDCLHVGPSLNPLLFDILVRFRQK